MNRRGGALLAAALAAALVVPIGSRAAAQSSGDAPAPSGADPGSALDYVATIFKTEGDTFERDVDSREITGERKLVNIVHFAVSYTTKPCPDVNGTAEAVVTVKVTQGGDLGVQERYEINLPIKINVNDRATYTKVHFAGRFFDAIPNKRGKLEDSVTRLQYAGTAGSAKAVVDNEGPYDKAELQKTANDVEKHAQALADSIAKKLQAVWQDGKSCVTLSVTPGSGVVKPKQQLQVNVSATAKDGAVIKRPVTRKLTGPTSIKPKASKSAPATFTYVAPATKGQKGHIAFEQRSKRGIGRAEVEYRLSEKWKFDLKVTKVPIAGGEQNIACYDVRCGTGVNLTGLSVMMELGDDGRGEAQGPAVLHVNMATLVLADCSVDNSVPVTMAVTVETVGDTFKVSSKSSPDPTYQWCGGFNHPGPENATTPVTFVPVSVPKAGGSGSTNLDSDFCLITAVDSGHYGCTYEVIATKVED
jgi:hypothetical protein